MKRLLLTTILGVAVSCASKSTPTPPPTADTVKPGAPTTLEAQVSGTSAKLALHFSSAGQSVSVTVSGIDGVTVTSPPEALAGAAVTAGEVVPLDVAFTGRGHLVVSVRGTFGGSVDARVHTVAIGEVPLKDDGSKVMRTDDGDTVKLMP